jgi:hypothetical protein
MKDTKNATLKPKSKPQILEQHFKDVPIENLWSRKEDKGFYTLPRTMPLIMEIIDELNVGSPASKPYLALWSKTEEKSLFGAEMVVPMGKDLSQFAIESGYSSNRNITTVEDRLKRLENLGFIKSATNSEKFFGRYEYILVMHPDVVIDHLHDSGRFKDSEKLLSLYRMYKTRLKEIGGERNKVKKSIAPTPPLQTHQPPMQSLDEREELPY